MKSKFFQKNLALALVFFFVNALCFQERAVAAGNEKNAKSPGQPAKLSGWHDNSPKGTSLTPVLIVGAAVIGAIIVFKVLKKDSNDDKKDEDKDKDKEENKGSANIQNGSFSELKLKLAESSNIDLETQPYFAPESFNDGSMKLQPMGGSFQFGISITF